MVFQYYYANIFIKPNISCDTLNYPLTFNIKDTFRQTHNHFGQCPQVMASGALAFVSGDQRPTGA